MLADHLAAGNRYVQWSSELTGFEQNEAGVTVHYKDMQGTTCTATAAYFVGCDGAASFVRHQLGLSFAGSTEPKLFYVADTIMKSSVINKDELYMHMIPKGFVLFFPMEGMEHYRIIGIIPGAEAAARSYTFTDVEPHIRQGIAVPIEFKEIKWFSTYKVHSRRAGRFRSGCCFLAGDAAHIHTPAGGQGMNTGIQDAYNLAWKIAYALKNEISDAVLETYDTERGGNAKHLLESTDRMFDIMSGSNPFFNFLRLNLLPPLLGALTKSGLIRKRFFPLISQTGIRYPHSYLTTGSSTGKMKAGDRMHYFVFSNGRHIFSYLTQPSFKLIYFGNERNNNSLQLKNTGLDISFMSFTEIPKDVFGANSDFYVFLRPDNHISYIGDDINKCVDLVRKWGIK